MTQRHPFAQLTQDTLIDWLESFGLESDYRIYPLNSYENRVYRVGLENGSPMVFKIYRPGRWNADQVREELSFTQELADAELDVVPAATIEGETLFERDDFLIAGFPMRAGHAFELDDPDKLYRIGQLLGRLHNIGAARAFQHRPTFSLTEPVEGSLAFFADSPLIPDDIRGNYVDAVRHILTLLQPYQTLMNDCEHLRIHGDFHAGNILTRDENILVVDFDDTVTGPAMQDIWKLLSGTAAEQAAALSELEEGYEQFRPFPKKELKLIEALRTSHMIKHALWIAKRWDDPAFPQAFTWFGNGRFWSEHLMSVREQWATLQDEEWD